MFEEWFLFYFIGVKIVSYWCNFDVFFVLCVKLDYG